MFLSAQRRRRPFPYDAIINGTGVMLMENLQGPDLQAEHPLPLTSTQPTDYKPSAQSPAIESSFEWRDFSLGFGLRQQVGDNDRRYRFARSLDCSVQNQVIFGPKLNTITPSAVDATNGISGFFEIGGKLYAVNGRYVHLRTSDADWNTSRKDLGVGKAALDHVHFFTNAGGGADYVYVAMGDSELLWRFDGTTWTQHGTLYARAVCMQGRNLWRSPGTNTLAKVDTDAEPWTAGNWTSANQFNVGEKGSNITRIVLNTAGVLVILKSDGIYVLDELGEAHQLFPGMRFSTLNTENGKYPYISENWIYTTYGGTHYRLDPSMSLEPIGPEQYADNDSVVKGYITAGIGTQFANYVGIYNPDTGHSYLLKFGAWVNDEQGGTKRIDAWHGSLSDITLTAPASSTGTFDSDKITAMWRSTIGAPSGHERLYIGMLSGKIYWMILPCVPNPANCTSYEYPNPSAPNTGDLFLPYWHGNFPSEEKTVKAVVGEGTILSSTNNVSSFHVRTAGSSASYTSYGSTNKIATSVPGGRVAIGQAATLADLVAVLAKSATATETPVVGGIGITYSIHPAIKLVYGPFRILAENNLRRHDGVPIRIGADRIKTLMKAAAELAVGVVVITPDEVSQQLVLQNYQESVEWDEELKQPRTVISLIGTAQDVRVLSSGAGLESSLAVFTETYLAGYLESELAFVS